MPTTRASSPGLVHQPREGRAVPAGEGRGGAVAREPPPRHSEHGAPGGRMSQSATYTFLPWLRQGVANQIAGHSDRRATIPIALTLSGAKLDGSGNDTRPQPTRNVEIYGPG